MPEHIPDEDDVSRHLFAPSMGSADADLVWGNVFMFRRDRGCRESVVWRKYAPAIDDVHALGCEKERRDRALGKSRTYFAALTANVGSIREIRSKNGAGFQVSHEPDEGIHHAEISYLPGEWTKPDKIELLHAIQKQFKDRSDHSCADEAA